MLKTPALHAPPTRLGFQLEVGCAGEGPTGQPSTATVPGRTADTQARASPRHTVAPPAPGDCVSPGHHLPPVSGDGSGHVVGQPRGPHE